MKRILIANRGEIVSRIIRTATKMRLETVALFTEADRSQPYNQAASAAAFLSGRTLSDTYLNAQKIVSLALENHCDAVHPGYGFLAENPEFAEQVTEAGLTFIGPPASVMRLLGYKDSARKLATEAGIPIVPGFHDDTANDSVLLEQAKKVGAPLVIKAVAGGGGRGFRTVSELADFTTLLSEARREAKSAFGDDRVFLEKLVDSPRHIEVQVFGDDKGNILHLFERDCTTQRRRQKLIEESPAHALSETLRHKILEAAVSIARHAKLQNASTVEFLVPLARRDMEDFYFIEVNTRLQVEHPVTEMVTGIDLVELQIRLARGEQLPWKQEEVQSNGHAVEVRVTSEIPHKNFAPSSGIVRRISYPHSTGRIDHSLCPGILITTEFDTLVAKIIAHGKTRSKALSALRLLLDEFQIAGIDTNQELLRRVLAHPRFLNGEMNVSSLEELLPELLPTSQTELRATRALAIALALRPYLGREPLADSRDPFVRELYFRPAAMQSPAQEYRVHGDSLISDKVFHTRLISFLTSSDDLHSFTAKVEVDKVSHTIKAAGSRPAENGSYLLEVNGETVRCMADRTHPGAIASGEVVIVLNGSTFFIIPAQSPSTKDASEALESNLLLNLLPGTVTDVLVKVGDRVEKGQPLLVIESMKISHTLVSANDNVVAEIRAAKNDVVAAGEVLVLFKN